MQQVFVDLSVIQTIPGMDPVVLQTLKSSPVQLNPQILPGIQCQIIPKSGMELPGLQLPPLLPIIPRQVRRVVIIPVVLDIPGMDQVVLSIVLHVMLPHQMS